MKRGSWTSILGIYLFGVCGASAVNKIVPLAADLNSHFGLALTDFGWLVSLIAIPAALFAIPSGMVVDRFGPKRVLIAAAAGVVLANALYFTAPGLALIQVARVLEGFAVVHMYTAAPAMLMATTEGNRRTRAMTVWSTYAPIGTSIGLAAGGLFAETDGWRNIFLVHGALAATAGVLCLLQPSVAMLQLGEQRTIGQRIRELGSAFLSPKLLLLGTAFFLIVSVGHGSSVTLPSHLAHVQGISMHEASNILASTTLAMVIGSLGVGVVLPLGVRPAVLLTGLAIAGFIVGTLCFFPDLDMGKRYAALFAWAIITGAALAAGLAMLPMVAEEGRQGSAAALMNFAGAAATFANPPLWLAIASGSDWTPFVVLMAVGWTLIAALAWGSTAMLSRSRRAARAAEA